MDFVEGLPKSNGYSVILVVVDRYSKYSHFIPLKHPYSAATVAQAFLQQVVKLHSMPLTITSDRDTVFTSHFWKELLAIWGPKLQMSTARHPQTDGQTERVNQCLEMYLRCAVHDSPTKWHNWLALAELWYNTTYHSSLGCTPFKALYGQDPHMGQFLRPPEDTSPDIQQWLQDRQAHAEHLKHHLQRAQ